MIHKRCAEGGRMRFDKVLRNYIDEKCKKDITKILTEKEISEVIRKAQTTTAFDVVMFFKFGVELELCGKCGKCCKISSPIHIADEEIAFYNQFFGMSFPKHIIHKDGKWYLKNTKPCEFLKDNKCSIYKQRPEICRSYPFNAKVSKGFQVDKECKIPENISKNKVIMAIGFEILKKENPEMAEFIEKRNKEFVSGMDKPESFNDELDMMLKIFDELAK